MGNKLKKIKIASFILIMLELVLIGVFAVFYFLNLFDIKNYVKDIYVIVGSLGLVFINCLFVWITTIRLSLLRQKTDLRAAEVIGSDIQEAYNFGMIGLAVTDENDVVLWTNDLFKARHMDIIDSNILSWQPDLEVLKNPNSPNPIAKIVANGRNYEVKYLPDAGLWIFKDNTDLESVYNYSREQAPVVGILAIDNYDDVVRGE